MHTPSMQKTAELVRNSESDEQLLRSFISTGDETAFETLVKRHGPLVWGLCTRVLRNHHDAEDAFQATFVILAQSATRIQQPDHLPNWLYGVAFRTAVKARHIRGTRKLREVEAAMTESWQAESSEWNQLAPQLDEALNSLNDKYRTPIIFHDLLGMSYEEAARQIGITARSFSMRLSRGRKMLRGKLLQMGIVLSVGSLTALVIQNGTPAIPQDSACANTARKTLHSISQISSDETISEDVLNMVSQSLNSVPGNMFGSRMASTFAWITVSMMTAITLFGSVHFFGTATTSNSEVEPQTSVVTRSKQPSAHSTRQSAPSVSKSITIYPVITDLQQLLIKQQRPKSPPVTAFVEIDFEEFLQEATYDFGPDSEQIRNLIRDLKSNSGDHKPEVDIQIVIAGDLSKSDLALVRELELAIQERAKQDGLADPVVTHQAHNSREGLTDWRSRRNQQQQQFSSEVKGKETPLAGDGYAIYPVETPLSRILTQDADSVFEFKDPIDLDKPLTLSDDLKKSAIQDIQQLKLKKGERITFLVSLRSLGVPMQGEFEQRASQNSQLINQELNEFSQELGFVKLSTVLRYLN